MNNLNHTCYTLSRNSNRCDVCGARLPRLIDADMRDTSIKGRCIDCSCKTDTCQEGLHCPRD